jgi:hypothetical protein
VKTWARWGVLMRVRYVGRGPREYDAHPGSLSSLSICARLDQGGRLRGVVFVQRHSGPDHRT